MTFPQRNPGGSSLEAGTTDLDGPSSAGEEEAFGTLEPEAIATGTWSTIPPRRASSPQPSDGEAARKPPRNGWGKYAALGLLVGFVAAGSAYLVSSGLHRDRSEAKPAGNSQPQPPPAGASDVVRRSPPTTASEASPASEGEGAELSGHGYRVASGPSPDARLRTMPLIVYRPGSKGIPTASYLDTVSTDDPLALAVLSEEVARFKQARRALERGDAEGVIAELDSHGAMPLNYHLATEAMVLRIEALVLRNNRAEATRLASLVLARHPRGPLGERMSAIVRGDAW
jgi:hypothetical protein